MPRNLTDLAQQRTGFGICNARQLSNTRQYTIKLPLRRQGFKCLLFFPNRLFEGYSSFTIEGKVPFEGKLPLVIL